MADDEGSEKGGAADGAKSDSGSDSEQEDGKPGKAPGDPNVRWLRDRVMAGMESANRAKWKKMMHSNEARFHESRYCVQNFCEEAEIRCILFYVKGNEMFAGVKYPPKLEKKSLYFIKDHDCPSPLTPEDLEKHVKVGDLGPAPLQHLALVVDEVYTPLLKNKRNHRAWPQVVAHDVLKHFHKLAGAVYVISGQTKGKTLLPLPPEAEGGEESAQDKSLVHQIESAVIEWTHQIRAVVKSSSQSTMKEGQYLGPSDELDFWEAKAENLQCIHDQLYDEKMKKIGRVLDISQSSYYPAFQNIYKEVDAALTEAYDIHKCMKPLRHYVDRMRDVNYEEIVNVFKPMLHTLALVWKESKYYTVSHLVVLAQEICNDMVKRTQEFVGYESVFKADTEDAVKSLQFALQVLNEFKISFVAYQNKINSQMPERAWRFENQTVFKRLDQFMARLEDLLDLMRTIVEFNRLEKVEVGGSKGKILTDHVARISQEFKAEQEVLQNIDYDALNIHEERYINDASKFRAKIKDLEQRISTVISEGFDDAVTVEASFKLLDSFHGMLHRQAIQHDFDKKYGLLLQMYSSDLDEVFRIFRSERDDPPIPPNVPAVAGSVAWSRNLRQRIEDPYTKLSQLDTPLLDTPHGQEVAQKYEQLKDQLFQYETERHLAWMGQVDLESSEKLNLPLLARSEEGDRLLVNFDPALVNLLREVKYLKYLTLEIPPSGAALFEEAETFRQHIAALDIIVTKYNNITATIIPVEKPLIEERLTKIDRELEQGINHLNWRSPGIGNFIASVMDSVLNVDNILATLKANVAELVAIMKNWSSRPLVERKDGKKYLDMDDCSERILQRSLEIELQGGKIHSLLRESRAAIQIEEEFEPWDHYVAYVNDIVKQGFFETVRTSLEYIKNNTNDDYLRKNELGPLYEVQLMLQKPEVVFKPPMLASTENDLKQLFIDLMNKFTKIGRLVKRLDSKKSGKRDNYFQELNEEPALRTLRNEILENINLTITDCLTFKNEFTRYSDLWSTDMHDYMESFQLYGKELNVGDEEILDREPDENPPTLEDFAFQINKQNEYLQGVSEIQDYATFHWLRVNVKPFKAALSNVIREWKNMFTQHLFDDVTSSLMNLENFINATNKGLNTKVGEGEYEALVQTMGVLRDVRERIDETDNMFKPLHEKIALLKEYEIEMPDYVMEQLNELPQAWTNLKRNMYAVRDSLTPLQQAEVAKIKRRRDQFIKDAAQFRVSFLDQAPLKWELEMDDAYKAVDNLNVELTENEQLAADLADQEDMFELTVTVYRELPESRKDLINLKSLWDMIALVRYQFEEWKQTQWREVNTDQMDADCKMFQKQIRNLPRETKQWDARIGLDTYVKNLMKSLRSISDLRSDAMRDRHWKQLMKETGVQFDMSGNVKLDDLLALKLHKYEDVVSAIVERAQKELRMEKQIADFQATWGSKEFIFEKHTDGTPMLKPADDLIETLEENMVKLQNMLVSKNVQYFQEKIEYWQHALSTVQRVMELWLEVQRTWAHMESIFIGSEDIRQQLPRDTERFARVHEQWKKLMYEAESVKNVIKACSRDGVFTTLRELEGELAKCSKALEQYLEMKRLVFPRFYFISVRDLLDILSKGNDPAKIMVHLSKLFDNMKKIDLVPDAQGRPNKKGTRMYSEENEQVDFVEPCDCTGAVEVWLNRLIDTMRSTLRKILGEAVETYEERGREQWILDYPSQIALTGSQIWWSTEVELAFERLEEGYENALKEYLRKQLQQLQALTVLLQGKLDKDKRQKIVTVCMYDTHARDVIRTLISEKVESATCFGWQSQLRPRWDEEKQDCFYNICDAEFQYQYEYLGNTSRLVITPLTDRCYITLTQSLRLMMGGAPAGPAGTGKTETTKDLGRALGVRVLVLNCSPQQTYIDLGNIYKGLAQSGMWGCFDEFNRISIEVLSVVATQVKSILDAVRGRKNRFSFMGEEINLNRTVGMFITMNPGYAGRTELPDNLKALFRPVSMVVPDFGRISEIMLIAEGFETASELALKFTTLYGLTAELLSKQDHYDWGLRAIKSVLVVAGPLKRADPQLAEDEILMRALRDFNLPKIVTADVPVFMNLLDDLFRGLNPERKVDIKFETTIAEVVQESGLQPEKMFVLKVVQLAEILDVRHSVFILGPSGSGKTEVWRMLAKTWTKMGRKTTTKDLNPKAVTTKELFGFSNTVTKEYTDGLFSKIMRDLKNVPNDDPKWIILDGDIDPDWIESLNTVMDDNKILTLPSNERIPLLSHMRLVFEIGNLRNATPATVSRAGILFLNESDLGWGPFRTSWIERRANMSEQSNLLTAFERYIPPTLEYVNKNLQHVVPISNFNMVQTLCYMLDGLLLPENFQQVQQSDLKDLYEMYFVFAVVWAIGGALIQDNNLKKYRDDFSSFFKSESRAVKFPTSGSVFDYYIDPVSHKWLPWTDKLPKYQHESDRILSRTFVATAETVRVRYFVDLFIRIGRPCMLVGPAGTGKTMLVRNMLEDLGDDYANTNINFNYYTDSKMLQTIMELSLERKVGRDYGPVGTKKLIYFVDDLNMPQLDKYYTQTPHTLLRQHIDYGHWYDRDKWDLKNVKNCQYISCMNPTTGSFTVDPRLQRQFATFAIQIPQKETLQHIYLNILNAHVAEFPPRVNKYADKIVGAALQLHTMVANAFTPTAIKFHYQFNLRHISNIFQGMLNSSKHTTKEPVDFARLWVHESLRTYGDVLTNAEEIQKLTNFVGDTVRKFFNDLREDDVFVHPLIFCHFSQGIGEANYGLVKDYGSLNSILLEAQNTYNELFARIDLVLFEDAMQHICRISRILNNGNGNALLVGVGGSGKQSLSRLAAHINGFEVFQIQIKQNYGMNELKTDLVTLYNKTGLRGDDIVFLLTDAQIVDERFLIYINDLLSTGDIPDLFTPDEKTQLINSIRTEVKQAGIMDTNEKCWDYFINKVRRHLHVVLCFSPVGDVFRDRYRKFPALVNNTSIDWFHPWPREALVSVAEYFLRDVDLGPVEMKNTVVQFIAHAHTSVEIQSRRFEIEKKRYNYTTPKSFLELIKLYTSMLRDKRAELNEEINRLLLGLEKLQNAEAQVEDLRVQLDAEKVEVEARTKATLEIVELLKRDTDKVQKEQEITREEENKLGVIAAEVARKQAACDEDLKLAEPALERARLALDSFKKDDIVFLRSLATPPGAVVKVLESVIVLQSGGRRVRDRSWKAARQMMADVNRFQESLVNFDKDNMAEETVKELQQYMRHPDFTRDAMVSKSVAAAGMCEFVINMVKYHEVYVVVAPKRELLRVATEQKQAAEGQLTAKREKLAHLTRNLEELQNKYAKANGEKLAMEERAKKTAETILLADRLVKGLSGEKVRWNADVENLRIMEKTLVGDVLLAAGFISYVGAFDRPFREELINNEWLHWLQENKVPLTENYDPLRILTNDAQIAKWNNESLPTDRISLENAAICVNCQRWPLIIDPQLQAVEWIRQREGIRENLKTVRQNQDRYLDVIVRAIEEGEPILIENVGEWLDPMLDPLLARNLIVRGSQTFMVIGGQEYTYNKNFRLFLQTKMGNPHFKPEVQAQTTLINFTVTQEGLEDQLLAHVVNNERQDLEEQRKELIRQQNEFEITLRELESSLLRELQGAQANFLNDTKLVENLEHTKTLANEITEKKKAAVATKASINKIRDNYRPVATRASLMYFLLDDLSKIDHMYQFSLKAFTLVFNKAIKKAKASEDMQERVNNLTDCITFTVYSYAARGLFERHKLIFSTMLCFRILQRAGLVNPVELDYLIRGKTEGDVRSPLDWATDKMWSAVLALKRLDTFAKLSDDIEGSSSRWKKWCEEQNPELVPMPQDWKSKKDVQKLCIIRALRPDRMINAIKNFIIESPFLGEKFVKDVHEDLVKTFEETTSATPLFFILSPGVDPLKNVEILGYRKGYTNENGKLTAVSLGQGQDTNAMQALDKAARDGTWCFLQNIHLMVAWLPSLEKKLEAVSLTADPAFRLFLSAEPNEQPDMRIPVGILQQCIKLTNEPPQGMKASMQRALANFDQDSLEQSSKETEFHRILVTMCYFHAVVLERRKFGPQGWNNPYNFNTGDLTISMSVLINYLENNSKVPWEDLRYIFGEIMYGGHISDDWDRRLCRTYLEKYLRDELLNDELELTDNFPPPPHGNLEMYQTYIEEMMPAEDPSMFGLNRTAEIGFLTQQSTSLFKTILELQPQDASGGGTETREESVKTVMASILEALNRDVLFDMSELYLQVGEVHDPYSVVALQECDRMNILVDEIRRSLKELEQGMNGDLTMSPTMETLMGEIYLDLVPATWALRAYPSLKPLGLWLQDLFKRIKQLEKWTRDFKRPTVVYLSWLFNPQSFLTAVMQATARKNSQPLDKMKLTTEVTKKSVADISTARLDGAYVTGLYLEGARWDSQAGCLADSSAKEVYSELPVVNIKAVPQDKFEEKGQYRCPVYKTRKRGRTYVWTFYLRTKHADSKWTLAGTAILLQVE